ncbi:MAG: hypothetical protein FJ028_02570 [Chloroflexi bacterium]|nr:hypothetical protein [Chloroflexota bacterium]
MSVATVVAERGKGEARSEETVQVPAGARVPAVVTGVELKRGDTARPAEVRVLAPQEKQDTPAPKVVDAPKPTARPELVPSLERPDPSCSSSEGDARPLVRRRG